MTSIGTGYDLSASTYSPDGRIFQVRRLRRAGKRGGDAEEATHRPASLLSWIDGQTIGPLRILTPAPFDSRWSTLESVLTLEGAFRRLCRLDHDVPKADLAPCNLASLAPAERPSVSELRTVSSSPLRSSFTPSCC